MTNEENKVLPENTEDRDFPETDRMTEFMEDLIIDKLKADDAAAPGEIPEKEEPEQPKKNRIWLEMLFFAALIALTIWLMFKDEDPAEIWQTIRDSNYWYIFAGLISIMVVQGCEGLNAKLTLRALGFDVPLRKCYKFTLIGAFFSAITPAASGGQPMEIYYMHKEGIPVGSATLVLLLNLLGYQVATISLATLGFLVNAYTLFTNGGVVTCFIIGISVNLVALFLLLVGIYSRRLSSWLVHLVLKILVFFRVKNKDKLAAKFESVLDGYHKDSVYIRKHPRVVLRVIGLAILQFVIFFGIAFWTYMATLNHTEMIGYEGKSFFELMSMQATVFGTVSAIPSPGSVGVSEGAFIAIMSNVYPESMIKSATILFRLVSFYFLVIVSAATVIANAAWVNHHDVEKDFSIPKEGAGKG